MQIRTPKGKLYGTLDIRTYTMTVIDGKNTRRFPVPRDGCELSYKAGDSPSEVISLPSQSRLIKQAT
jgi:hypothetical protein